MYSNTLVVDLPSPPTNLQQQSLNSSADSNYFYLRLEWDPPEDYGGVNITNYQVFVDNFLQVTTPDTVAIVELNSTGEHLVQVRAGSCVGYGANLTRPIVILFGSKTSYSIMITLLN